MFIKYKPNVYLLLKKIRKTLSAHTKSKPLPSDAIIKLAIESFNSTDNNPSARKNLIKGVFFKKFFSDLSEEDRENLRKNSKLIHIIRLFAATQKAGLITSYDVQNIKAIFHQLPNKEFFNLKDTAVFLTALKKNIQSRQHVSSINLNEICVNFKIINKIYAIYLNVQPVKLPAKLIEPLSDDDYAIDYTFAFVNEEDQEKKLKNYLKALSILNSRLKGNKSYPELVKHSEMVQREFTRQLQQKYLALDTKKDIDIIKNMQNCISIMIKTLSYFDREQYHDDYNVNKLIMIQNDDVLYDGTKFDDANELELNIQKLMELAKTLQGDLQCGYLIASALSGFITAVATTACCLAIPITAGFSAIPAVSVAALGGVITYGLFSKAQQRSGERVVTTFAQEAQQHQQKSPP